MCQCVSFVVLQQEVNHMDFRNLIRFSDLPAFDLAGSNKAISVMATDTQHFLKNMYVNNIRVLPEHVFIGGTYLCYIKSLLFIQKWYFEVFWMINKRSASRPFPAPLSLRRVYSFPRAALCVI